MMARLTDSLGQFEQMILTAVMTLRDGAYGMSIYSKVCELADRQVNLGSVYVTLDRLQKKGYVTSTVEKGKPKGGGKARRFYRVEGAGFEALRESVETAARVSESFAEATKAGKWKKKRAR